VVKGCEEWFEVWLWGVGIGHGWGWGNICYDTREIRMILSFIDVLRRQNFEIA